MEEINCSHDRKLTAKSKLKFAPTPLMTRTISDLMMDICLWKLNYMFLQPFESTAQKVDRTSVCELRLGRIWEVTTVWVNVWAMSQCVCLCPLCVWRSFEVPWLKFPNLQSFSPDIRNSKRSSLKPLSERSCVFRKSSGNGIVNCVCVCVCVWKRNKERNLPWYQTLYWVAQFIQLWWCIHLIRIPLESRSQTGLRSLL